MKARIEYATRVFLKQRFKDYLKMLMLRCYISIILLYVIEAATLTKLIMTSESQVFINRPVSFPRNRIQLILWWGQYLRLFLESALKIFCVFEEFYLHDPWLDYNMMISPEEDPNNCGRNVEILIISNHDIARIMNSVVIVSATSSPDFWICYIQKKRFTWIL